MAREKSKKEEEGSSATRNPAAELTDDLIVDILSRLPASRSADASCTWAVEPEAEQQQCILRRNRRTLGCSQTSSQLDMVIWLLAELKDVEAGRLCSTSW
uniref:F-box domain-containing protein n=1 Tax=Oryza rufipogon TaxID=4529 RepID=A0A0E0PI56_ORYRU